MEAFAKADDTLSVAAKSIAEIITLRGEINLDFRDVSTVLKDGGVAIMSTAYGEGEGRVSKAIEEALNSPLLNHSDIFKSKKVLLNICFCKEKEGESLMMEEMNEVHEFMSKFEANVEVKFGMGTDPTLGKKVKITILATGFGLSDVLSGVEGADKYKQVVVDEEEEERKRARREIFYNYEKGAKVKRRYKLFRFSKRTLDDDDVISMVETSPTYKRDNESLRQIKDRVEEINNRNAEEGTEILESDGLTINFK